MNNTPSPIETKDEYESTGTICNLIEICEGLFPSVQTEENLNEFADTLNFNDDTKKEFIDLINEIKPKVMENFLFFVFKDIDIWRLNIQNNKKCILFNAKKFNSLKKKIKEDINSKNMNREIIQIINYLKINYPDIFTPFGKLLLSSEKISCEMSQILNLKMSEFISFYFKYLENELSTSITK